MKKDEDLKMNSITFINGINAEKKDKFDLIQSKIMKKLPAIPSQSDKSLTDPLSLAAVADIDCKKKSVNSIDGFSSAYDSESVTAPFLGRPKLQRKKYNRKILFFFRYLINRVRGLTIGQILFVFFLMILVTSGNAMQIIGLNFWLRQFPGGNPGNFSVLAISGLLFGLFFLTILAFYIFLKRPRLRFCLTRESILLIIGIALMDTLNSTMSIYAASETPEVLQALFTSLMPLYTCIFSKYILHDCRSFLNPWVIVSFFLLVVGVVIAAVPSLAHSDSIASNTTDTLWWSVIFFFSIPPTSLMNVWQTKYMEKFTALGEAFSIHADIVDAEEKERVVRYHASAQNSGRNTPVVDHIGHGAMGDITTLTPKKVEHNEDRLVLRSSSKDLDKDCSSIDKKCDRINKIDFNTVSVAADVDPSNVKNAGLNGTLNCRENDNLDRAFKSNVDEKVISTDASSIYDSLNEAHAVLNPSTADKKNEIIYPDPATEAASSGFVARQNIPQGLYGSNDKEDNNGKERDDDIGEGVEKESVPEGDDTTVKLVMLTGDTTMQFVFIMMLLPADALPWWGGSHSVRQAADNFVIDTQYIFTNGLCFTYGAVYSLGFVFTYIGSAYLNHYSATLCSIIGQLSSPLTALMLIIVPRWNLVKGDNNEWYYSFVAVVLLIIGTLLYAAWEELTVAPGFYSDTSSEYPQSIDDNSEKIVIIRSPRSPDFLSYSPIISSKQVLNTATSDNSQRNVEKETKR